MDILAMDLGQRMNVTCQYNAETGEHAFGRVPATPFSVRAHLVSAQPDRLVIEIGPTAGWVCDIAADLGIEVEVANTNHEAWRWRQVKHKSDRRDALKLAQLSAMHQLPTVHMPGPEGRQWRSLIAYRQTLVKRRTQIKNNIRAILSREGLSMPSGKSGWTLEVRQRLRDWSREEDGASWRVLLGTELPLLDGLEEAIHGIEKELEKVAAQDDRVALLKTIPGVGDRLSEAVVAVLDDPHRFATGKQVASYVGLAPKQYQSGSMNRQGGISGHGNAMLRSLLVEVSWLGLRHNPWMREVYERVLRGSASRKKIAIVAVARRLLIRCWAMLRDGTKWNRAGDRAGVQGIVSC